MTDLIQDDQKKELEDRVKRYGETLHHYCSPMTLKGFLEKKEIWFCSTANMNDYKEQRHFIETLYKELRSFISESKQEKFENFFKELYAMLETKYSYVVCFTTLVDNAAQWERYATNAKGLCIGFNTEKLLELFFNSHVIFSEIEYNCDAKKHEFFNGILNYIEHDILMCGFENICQVQENILAYSSIIKHQSFETEKEVRIIVPWGKMIPEVSKFEYELIKNNFKKVLKVDIKATPHNRQTEKRGIEKRCKKTDSPVSVALRAH